MCSKSKIQKCSNNLPAMLDDDRFSDLPTCLIVKILSLLPAKDVVVTSALSKTWKQLWTFVTNLDFDDALMNTASVKDLIRIVNQVLLLHDKPCLQRFRLKCSKKGDDGFLLNAWVSNILPCNLQELDLSVPIKCPVWLSPAIFLCKTLVVLKINVKGKVNMPTSISLPNLKTLQLDTVEISDDASLASLLNGCTVLEELKMARCIGKNVRIINIISRTLTNLTLVSLAYDGGKWSTTPMKYRIVLDTPSLRNIYVIDDVAEDYAVKKFNHLTEADISIEVAASVSSDGGEMHTKALTGLFNALALVQTLRLSSSSLEAVRWFVFELPQFSNLTKLEIITDYSFASNVLATFLEKSPCLETLNLPKLHCNDNHLFSLGHNDIVPSCFRSHLKLIKLHGFVGAQKEMEMVEFILKNAQVLEKLDLRCPISLYDTWEEDVFLREILKFPKASYICRIEVV